MSIQHKDISDGDRHEVKGASTAVNKTVCMSNGDGTTSFSSVSYNDLTDIPVESFLYQDISGSSSASSQLPTATDTALQVTFGTGSSTSDTTLGSDGSITLNFIGPVYINTKLNFGRTSGTGVSVLMVRALLNGTQLGDTFSISLDDNASSIQYSRTFYLYSGTVGGVVTFEIIRDSSGINNGGLYKTAATASGWNDTPCASVEVYKLG